jgi:hypothetical protein
MVPLFSLSASTLQLHLPKHLSGQAARYFSEHEDVISIFGKLDAHDTRRHVFDSLGIDQEDVRFKLAWCLFRTLVATVGLTEVETICGAGSNAANLWSTLSRRPRAPARWVVWVNGLLHDELVQLLLWFNTRRRDEVVDPPVMSLTFKGQELDV